MNAWNLTEISLLILEKSNTKIYFSKTEKYEHKGNYSKSDSKDNNRCGKIT